MAIYVALLRGVMPGNPATSNASLVGCFTALGFKDVQTVISSGNVIFRSNATDHVALERKIEKWMAAKLGVQPLIMVRSQAHLEELIRRDPFKGIKDEKPNYLIVTFFKDNRAEVATKIDLSKTDGPTMMSDLEMNYGKEVTTRTWKTVHRIYQRMELKKQA